MWKLLGNAMTRGQLTKVGAYIPRTKEELIARLLVGQIVLVFTKYRNQWKPCFLEIHASSVSDVSKMMFKIPVYSEFVIWKFVFGIVDPHTDINYVHNGRDMLYKRVLLYEITPDQCRQLNIY